MNFTRSALRIHRLTFTQSVTTGAVLTTGFLAIHIYTSKPLMAESPTKAPAKAFKGGLGIPFVSLELESAEFVSHDTKHFRFKLPSPDAVSGLSLTSALVAITWPKGKWVPAMRPYTPANDLDTPGYLDFYIKRYENGKGSTYLHSLSPGDSVSFMPIKAYPYEPNIHTHIALLAGGAGITPMVQLIRNVLKNSEDKTAITLVWGVNGEGDVFLDADLQALAKRYPGRFNYSYTVSNAVEGSPYRKGYITEELLGELGIVPGGTFDKVLVCGPPAMEKAIYNPKGGVLANMGWKKDQVYKF